MKQYRDVQLPTVFNLQGQLHVLKILGPGNVIKLNHLSTKSLICIYVRSHIRDKCSLLSGSSDMFCLQLRCFNLPFSCSRNSLKLHLRYISLLLSCTELNLHLCWLVWWGTATQMQSKAYVHVSLKLNNCTEYLKCTDRPFVGTDILLLNSPLPL